MHTINRTIYANLLLAVVAVPVLVGFLTSGAANAQGKTKIRVATASPSLSYLPIYTAVKKGFFAKRGFDVEMIQMSASLTAPALLNHSIDYTTIPSTIATATARGAPAKVIFFASVKLQHMLTSPSRHRHGERSRRQTHCCERLWQSYCLRDSIRDRPI